MCTNCPVVEYIEHLEEYQISIVEYSTQNAVSTNGGNDDDSIQQLLNDTDSELSGLSHLDAPNESLYMIGGVLIAMFLVGVIIILLAVTISKLRKREEHNNTVHPTDVVLQTATTTTPLPTQPSTIVVSSQTEPVPYHGQVLWQFPPQPQHLYSNNQETLVQSIPTERPGFVQGFRKNLGGRWRRLVKKKPTPEVYTIPPELRPQLKTIYVY